MKSILKHYSDSVLAYLQEELEETIEYFKDEGKDGADDEIGQINQNMKKVKAMTSLHELIEFETEYGDSTAESALDFLIDLIENPRDEDPTN